MKTGTKIIYRSVLFMLILVIYFAIAELCSINYINKNTCQFLYMAHLFIILFTSLSMRFRDKQPSANKSVNIFLALKVSKIFVALILTTIYLTVIKTEVKQFILCFAGIYMIYLIFDTAFLLHSEQIAKRNKTKE